MSLGAPNIMGPVSTCSEAVRLVGQFSASRVRIYIDGDPAPLADTTVGFSDATVTIDQTRLVVDRTLRAEQEFEGETSEKSPTGSVVRAAENDEVQFAAPIHICAQAMMLTGCEAGGRIEVSQGGLLLGQSQGIGDQADVTFLPGRRISGGSQLKVSQVICGSAAAVVTTSTLPLPAPLNPQGKLPPPRFEQPVESCQRLVTVHDIVPGAVVTLLRGGSPIYESPISLPTTSFLVNGLATGENLDVHQSNPLCESRPDDTDSVIVAQLTTLSRPCVDGPLCAGAHQITVSRLKPGATLRLFDGATEIGRWEAGATSMKVDINVPYPPAVITARQELCSVNSPMSRGYTAASNRSGRWSAVEDGNGGNLLAHSFAIHAAVVRTGKIVLFSGDQHSSAQNRADPQDINHCELFDCSTFGLVKTDAPTTDVFCSGHALLPDGRLLVVGGTEEFPPGTGFHDEHFPGLPDSWIFDATPPTGVKHWSKAPSMRGGRWYPTLAPLRDGSILALSGHPEETDQTRHNNNSLEQFRPTPPVWQHQGDSPSITSGFSGYLYPRIFAAPGGSMFSATPVEGGQSARWLPGSGTAWTNVAGPRGGNGWGAYAGFSATAVLLPLLEEDSFRAHVVLSGASQAWIIDLGTPRTPFTGTLRWRLLAPRASHLNGVERLHGNSVLLPSGEVFFAGGVVDPPVNHISVREPEMLVRGDPGPDPQDDDIDNSGWRWATDRFAQPTITRNYHSTALLMPDGRVWTGGSNIGARSGTEADDVRTLDLEIYEPWYCCADRPVIISAPETAKAGARFFVKVKSQHRITRLALLRAGSATHGFNPDQRFLGLKAVASGKNQFIGAVPSSDIAIPGIYLLFACTDRNVPSKGVFIRVQP